MPFRNKKPRDGDLPIFIQDCPKHEKSQPTKVSIAVTRATYQERRSPKSAAAHSPSSVREPWSEGQGQHCPVSILMGRQHISPLPGLPSPVTTTLC